MRLTQRTASHLKETADGLRLLAAQRAGSSEPIQFPPPEFVHGDADMVDVAIGPTGSIRNSNALFKPDRPWVNPTPPHGPGLAHPSTA